MDAEDLKKILESVDEGAWIEIKDEELVIDGHFNVKELDTALEKWEEDLLWRLRE